MVHFTPVPENTLFSRGKWNRLHPASIIKFLRTSPVGIVILLLFILLLLTVILGITTSRRARIKSNLDPILVEIGHKYEEGVALIDLNPVRARQLLTEAKKLIEEKLTGEELTRQLQKVNESLAVAVRRYEVTLTPYFELNLVKSGGEGKQLSLYQDALIILDKKNHAIYRLSLSTKSVRVLAGSEKLTAGTTVAVHGEDVFVLTDDIAQITLPGGELIQVIPQDPEWGKISALAAYAGNLYLLDTVKNQIWKYIRMETVLLAGKQGFSDRQDYLLHDTLVNLNEVTELVIDGHVWIVRNGDIIRFSQGQETPWRLTGLDEPLGSNLDIYTDDTTKNVYVLDQDHKRVLVVDKDGMYLSQYVWQETRPISDIVVSEVLQKILLLSGGTIYGIELK